MNAEHLGATASLTSQACARPGYR